VRVTLGLGFGNGYTSISIGDHGPVRVRVLSHFRSAREGWAFDFAHTTANIAAALATPAAFFTASIYDGFFAGAVTCKARNRSLAVTSRA